MCSGNVDWEDENLNVKKEASRSQAEGQLDAAEWAELREALGAPAGQTLGAPEWEISQRRSGPPFNQVRAIIFPDCSQENLFLFVFFYKHTGYILY